MRYTEEQLKLFTKPLSETEKESCERALRMIKDVFKKHNFIESSSQFLNREDGISTTLLLGENLQISIFIQGSYANNTNVKSNSDIDIALELGDITKFMDVYGHLSTIFSGNIDILLVSDLLSPKTNIGSLVKKNFLNDRVLIYQKLEEAMVENLVNNPRMRDITEYNEVTQNAIKESLEKYKTEGITKSSESIDNYFERMVRENTK